MLVLVIPTSFERTEFGVTSLPVPEVVGICMTGRALGSGDPANIAAFGMGFTARSAMTFAASMAEPPPMPMTKAAPHFLASFAPR